MKGNIHLLGRETFDNFFFLVYSDYIKSSNSKEKFVFLVFLEWQNAQSS